MATKSLYEHKDNQEEVREYTISLFTENHAGLLHRISSIFTRRKVNIESITASESEIKDVHRYTIVTLITHSMAIKLVRQIEKQVEVLKAFYHLNEETVFQEIALYKVPTKNLLSSDKIEHLLRKHFARILDAGPEFFVIEKTGHKEETQALFNALEPFHVLEFVRSGRVAITKPMKELRTHLSELEQQVDHYNTSEGEENQNMYQQFN